MPVTPKAEKTEATEEEVSFWLFVGMGSFLGVAVGWLLWPVLGASLLFHACFRWFRGKLRWFLVTLWLLAGFLATYSLAAVDGGMVAAGEAYVRLQWEFSLWALGLFVALQAAPLSVLWDHLRLWPIVAVSFTFGPFLGILLSVGHTGVASRDSSPATLPPKGEAAEGGNGGEGTPGEPAVRWMTGADFAEMPEDVLQLIWGFGIQLGAVTGWIGVPKVGKSEAYTQLIAACVLGLKSFLGVPVYPTSVVVLAEETAQVYRDKALTAAGWMERATIRGPRWLRPWKLRLRRTRRALAAWWTRRRGESPRDIYVLCGKELRGAKSIDNLPYFLDHAVRKARAVGAKVIVLDSLNFWVPQAITNDAISKQAAGHLGHVASLGFAVIVIHHMNKKGEMAGPDSLYSQLDFRVDCLVPGDADPRTTDLRQLLWSGRFPRDYPPEKRTLMYRMASGKLVPLTVHSNAGAPVIGNPSPAEESELPAPGEDSPSEDRGEELGLDAGCRIVWAWFRETDAEGVTADQIVAGIRATGKMKSPGRIKEHVIHLADLKKLATDGKGVRGDPILYSMAVPE